MDKTDNQTMKMDMLHGSIWNKLIQYALPVAATGILEQLFNASDIAIVGNFAGDAKTIAVAAVGANSSIIGLILNLFIGIALGANVVIANAIGRKDHDTIKKAVHTSVIMSVIGGLLVTLIGELFIGRLLAALHVPDEVFPYALLYIRIYLLGMPVILLYNFEAAIFRSIGETKTPLKALAASSAAFNIEIFAYDVMNSFSQACTTFTGQNYGAGQLKRCRKVLALCIIEDAIATASAIALVLLTGKTLLSVFNNDPQVIEIGYIRLRMVFFAYIFSMLYENLSGYLRGFGISLAPAILTTIGVCGVRMFWIFAIFPSHQTFRAIMTAYPVSLSATALLILIATIVYHPSRRFQMMKEK